ncbi:hypothetical protein C7974DRAFT_231796 [Boeremia exigua]|uniref:uncharacterized protein n=1 Tax=Boeremia exigua TaxID=749465 RepID=UPI001E8EBA2F|nr:uncharacterized protein C7974DRAFT_231796 [Boeremia exigua]KAH6620344.1 hypothetical protein C7974DRAFT_231796 [Boeremia exigua]
MELFHLCSALFCLVTVSVAAPAQPRLRQTSDVPEFVLKYAPVLYMHSEESHFPTDLNTFLGHTTPRINYNPVPNTPNPLTLTTLPQLGADVYLTSNDDVTSTPDWLRGTPPASDSTTTGTNSAIVINTKSDNSVDVFYFYFYAFNPGTAVLSVPFLTFGAHVGDWEHTMLRFPSPAGPPDAVWFSQHANGQAFRYAAVEKDADGIRPVVYVAKGSHANYAIPGIHSHVIPNLNLPFGALQDYTNKGKRWDSLGSSHVYRYDASNGAFTAYDDAPVEWLGWKGRWGDEAYPDSDKRQVTIFGQKKYVGGPTGPVDKQLDRKEVCPDNGIRCILRSVLVPRDLGDGEAFD